MRVLQINQLHLEYRPSGFHWRRRWPQRWLGQDMAPPSKKMSLLFPLRTHLLAEAKVLAQKLTFLTDIAFARRTETTMAIGPQIMATYLEELGRFLVSAHEAAREVAPQLSAEAASYEAACSQAAINALRCALAHRDRGPARQPLRDVAARLGVDLDEEDEDWPRLAYRALRVMLDAAEENARRDVGIFDAPSPFFRTSPGGNAEVRHTLLPAVIAPQACIPPLATPAGFVPAEMPTMRSPDSQVEAAPTVLVVPLRQAKEEDIRKAPGMKPADRTKPLATGVASMRLGAYFDLYIAKKVAGYTDEFGEEEVPDEAAGRSWVKSSRNNAEVGKRLWIGLLGDRPLCEITDEQLREQRGSCAGYRKRTGKAARKPGTSTS
ncbi:hypothetical protein [uncultured Paracoccus sp.]|uniref:hypothetical protein n=1 Tax=uncultured Paracoccus sp. TaxID=189685 RepID=UPI0025FF6FFF|nr:hypothetical protein [uncultured Paracoccus sp.]